MGHGGHSDPQPRTLGAMRAQKAWPLAERGYSECHRPGLPEVSGDIAVAMCPGPHLPFWS